MGWLYQSVGMLVVTEAERKAHVAVDPGIVDLTRALIPPQYALNRTRYAPHISVVRDEQVPRWERLAELDGRLVGFSYDPRVVSGEVYWWLRVWSIELLAIRRYVGLPDLSELCRPPDGAECFHTTIGNTKGRGSR